MSVQKLIFPGLIVGHFLPDWADQLAGGKSPSKAGKQRAPARSPVQNRQQEQAIQRQSLRTWIGLCQSAALIRIQFGNGAALIEQYARETALDPNLISAVMLQESAGRPDAYSKSGAVGLLQVMPRDGKAAGFMCKNGPCFADRPSMKNCLIPSIIWPMARKCLSDLISAAWGYARGAAALMDRWMSAIIMLILS